MTEKTNIDDIIGLIKTEEKTDSVELKKEYYKNIEVDLTLRLIEASVLEEVLEVLEKNNASPILIGKVKLALR